MLALMPAPNIITLVQKLEVPYMDFLNNWTWNSAFHCALVAAAVAAVTVTVGFAIEHPFAVLSLPLLLDVLPHSDHELVQVHTVAEVRL